MRMIGHGLGPGLTTVATRRSVIFNVEGLEFVLTFLRVSLRRPPANRPRLKPQPSLSDFAASKKIAAISIYSWEVPFRDAP